MLTLRKRWFLSLVFSLEAFGAGRVFWSLNVNF